MKRLLHLFVLFTLILVGCAPVPTSPTDIPKPTSQYKAYKITKGTGLYEVCGDADAMTLAELPAGTELYAFGKADTLDCCKFSDSGMDFELCHMQVISTGETGWVLRKWFEKTNTVSSKEPKPSATPLPTATQEPTITPTPKTLLTTEDIVNGLRYDAFLPSGYEPGQVRFTVPDYFEKWDYPQPDDEYELQITKNNDYEGRVVLFLYSDKIKGLEAYEVVKSGYFDTEDFDEASSDDGLLHVALDYYPSPLTGRITIANYCGRINILLELTESDDTALNTYLAYLISIVDDYYCPEEKK
jgi:hypothetical protein